jgi:hypothetical protein
MSIRWQLAALAFSFLGASTLAAQTSATGVIPARARVGAQVSLSNPTELDFGSLLAGQTTSPLPPQYSASVPHAGSIQLDSADPITLNVTIDTGDELRRGNTRLTTVLTCGAGESATATVTTSINCVGQAITPLSGATVFAGRTVFIFVGGTTQAPTSASAGDYTGTVTVRVAITGT